MTKLLILNMVYKIMDTAENCCVRFYLLNFANEQFYHIVNFITVCNKQRINAGTNILITIFL